jgi:hypothetical protein
VILGSARGQSARTYKLTPHTIRPGGEYGADRGGAGTTGLAEPAGCVCSARVGVAVVVEVDERVFACRVPELGHDLALRQPMAR